MAILNILDELASDASRNFKIATLEKYKNNDTLQTVIFLALDPFTQFYIRKIPKYIGGIHTITFVNACKQLKKLSSREYTGNAAIDMLASMLESLPQDDARVIERIIQKDLKCGVAASTVNKVWPGMIHEYPCMLCTAYDEKVISKFEFPAMVQLKMDGMRFNAIVKDGAVEFRSRNGKEINLLGNLSQEFITLSEGNDLVFDGELVLLSEDGSYMDRQTGNGILNKAVKGTISADEAMLVSATLWDVIPYEEFKNGVCTFPYEDRFARIKISRFSAGKLRIVTNTYVESLDQARSIFNAYLAEGEEGIILKSMTGIWEDKRTKSQIKFKAELDCDLKIVDVQEGTGKYSGMLGAVIAESADGLLKVSIGSGFSDAMRTEFWSDRDILLAKIVAVKYNARISNKQGEESLFLPIFLEIREDKTSADMTKDIK